MFAHSNEARRNSHALVASLTQQLRLAFIDISNEANINSSQFKQAFCRVFNGVTDDTIDQLFDGFIKNTPSTYTIYNNTINYHSLLKDDRLKRILLILHNHSVLQITELHRDASEKLLGDDDDDMFEGQYDDNQRALIMALLQKLRHSFGEIAKTATISLDEFKLVFDSVFMGVTNDIYLQIFNGFDVLNTGKIDYYSLLSDNKLPQILLLLHNNAMSQISTLQSADTMHSNNNGETAVDAEYDENNIFNPSSTVFDIVNNLKKEKQELLRINEKLKTEIFDKSMEIGGLNEENGKLEGNIIEWRRKYEMEIEQNKAFKIELENDLEEEYKSKLDKIVIEYELKLFVEREKYQEIINSNNNKYEILQKQIERIKQCTNNNGMFGVIKNLFNSTEIDLNHHDQQQQQQQQQEEEIGIITLDMLHSFNSMNTDKRLISIYGLIFDVTSINKYGPNGTYHEFTGHDITLCVIFNKWDNKWLDKFVQLNYEQIQSVKEYIKSYKNEYKNVGKLKNYQEIQSNWPKLTNVELKRLENDDCIIM